MTLAFARAQILIGKPDAPETTLPAQFNPASLRVTTTNQIDDAHPNQVAKPTTYKLDVELLFDTTETGADVVETTKALRDAAAAVATGATSGQTAKKSSNLKIVTFHWGTMKFTGYIESLNETLDYWSSDGVPMRTTFQISLKSGPETFLTNATKTAYSEANAAPPILAMSPIAAAANSEADFLAQVRAAGDRSTGRGAAAANGIESMRGTASPLAGAGASASAGASAGASASASASASAGFTAGASAQLQAAAGFKMAGGVSAGASAGFGMGASAGLSASAGLGASVGVGMAAGAGIGGGLSAGVGIGAGIGGGIGLGGSSGGFGVTTSVTGFDGVTKTASAFTGLDGTTRSSTTTQGSAGISASAGAFAGLGSSRTTLPGAGFDPEALMPPPTPGAGANASYDVSGRVVSSDGQVAASYSARAGVQVW